jgi:hypothetical protein
MGIHVVSAPPLVCSTFNKAMPAPAQTGSSRTAMRNLIHFGTAERIQKTEFRIQTKPLIFAD